jgi:hypothetical protein
MCNFHTIGLLLGMLYFADEPYFPKSIYWKSFQGQEVLELLIHMSNKHDHHGILFIVREIK